MPSSLGPSVIHELPRLVRSSRLALLISLSVLAALLVRHSTEGYSFWLDELATVSLFHATGGQSGAVSGFWAYLMRDNFPPLYFLLIQPWVGLFGLSEVSLRLFSLVATLAAITLIGWFVLRYERSGWIWPALATALLGTIPTVAYVAQEARPYALLLLFATLAVTSAVAVVKQPAHTRWPFAEATFLISSFLLSLTHYFGLLLTLLLAAANLFVLSAERKLRNLALIAVCLIWPWIHVSQGRLLTQTGGNFWIQVQPIVGTLKVLLVTCPFLLLLPLLGLTRLASRSSVGGSGATSPNQPELSRSLCYLAMVLFGFIGLMLLADLQTPLSIPRYYIAIVPVAVLFVVELLQSVFTQSIGRVSQSLVWVLVGALVLAQAVKAQQRLGLKSLPDQDWKTLARVVRTADLCRNGCDALGYTAWGEYYFHSLSLHPLDPAAEEDIHNFRIDRPLLGFHRAAALIPALQKANPQAICLEPRQSLRGSTFVMINPDRLLPSLRRQLLPCLSSPRP